MTVAAMRGPKGPGRLVVREDHLTWTSPEQPGRRLGLDEANATFQLHNPGGSAVKVVGVESSCGCATPRVEPSTIEPGGAGMVAVHALPLQVGERSVSVVLKTDSPATPRVVLSLKIVGSRRPPFLGRVVGDLYFRGDLSEADVRRVEVQTAEFDDSEPKVPEASSDLPYLQISPGYLIRETPGTKPGVVSRSYQYDVRIVRRPEEASFAGEVRVIDPWEPGRAETLRVHGDVAVGLKAAPSRLILRSNRAAGAPSRPARVILLASEPTDWSKYSLNIEAPGEVPVRVGPIVPDETGRGASFEVEPRSGADLGAACRVVVRGGDPSLSTSVPVLIRGEGAGDAK